MKPISVRLKIPAALLTLLLATLLTTRLPAEDRLRVETLPNGVRLALEPNQLDSFVAFTMQVQTGPDLVPADRAAGEIVAHALFYGSSNRSFEDVSASVSQVGGSLTTRRTADSVTVTCVTGPRHWREAAYLLCEALKNADFTPEALARARADIGRLDARRAVSPFLSAYNALVERTQGLIEPDPSTMDRVNPESARAYFQTRYLPSRVVFAAAGHFDSLAVMSALENMLFDFDRRAPGRASPPSAPQEPSDAPLRVPAAGDAAYALIGTQGPRAGEELYPAFVVLRTLLGGGHGSRLFRRVRESEGFGYTVGTASDPLAGGPLVAYVGWNSRRSEQDPAVADKALRRLGGQLDAVLSEPPGEEELDRARKLAAGQWTIERELPAERAEALAWSASMATAAYDRSLPGLFLRVSRDDVIRAARTYTSRRISAVALPPRLSH